MKKLLLTLILAIAFGGSMFAQEHYWDFTSHFETQNGLVAYVQIDGQIITYDDNFEAIEVAMFVNDEIRGTYFMYDGEEEGDPFPTVNNVIYYNDNETGATVTFKMYNHATSTLYENCELPYVQVHLGEEHFEVWDLLPVEECVVLNFVSGGGITKEITPEQWYLISTPSNVNPSAVTNMLENTYDLYYFDQKGDSEGKEWINRKASETELNEFNLELGHGYLYANSGDGEGETYTLTFPSDGAYAETTLAVDLDYFTDNEDETMHGWNIVGNPYNATATLDKPFYRLEGGIFNPYDAGTAVDALEGALVKAEAAGETVNITMGESAKKALLALNLTEGGNLVDRAIVGFGQGSNLPKFQFNNSSKVYFPMEGKEYAIVRSEGMGEMPVSFKAESNGTYNLNLSTENVEFSYLHLIDNLTGADQDLLANPSYSFSANTTDYASRFRLVFATGSDENNFAFFSNGSLFVNNEGNATLQVVDVTGRIIMSESINGSANINIDAAPGVYMVRLVNGDNMKVQKVVK